MNRWSKIALIVAGASLALGALMSLLLKTQRQAPPSPISWDSRAVEATFEGVRVREVDATHAALVLLYDLTNTTGSDYRLEKDSSEVIMSRLKPGGILSSDTQVVLDNAAFIPVGSRTRVAIEMDGQFNWPTRHDAAAERAVRQFVAAEVADVGGFVLFDQPNRYQIELPVVAPQLQASAASAAVGTPD
jgi:hypothetical protein